LNPPKAISAERSNRFIKKIDFWLGVPLVYLLSAFKTQKPQAPKVRSIAIFAFAAIGDSILSSTLFTRLRELYPEAKITIFSSLANASVYSLLDGFDELIILPIKNPIASICEIRRHSIDLLIDTSQWSRIAAVYAALSAAKWTIGFKTDGQHRHLAYDSNVEHQNDCHEIENFHRLLTSIRKGSSSAFSVPFAPFQGDITTKLKLSRYVVFHPWASGTHSEMREWPLSNWAELGKYLLEQGVDLLITGGPQDISRCTQLCSLINGGDHIQIAAGNFSLQESAIAIQGTLCTVAVNTGIMHLSAALGVPTISLNGPTNASRWGGKGSLVSNISVPPSEGGAYLNLGFEYPKNPEYVMNTITVEQVKNALKDRLHFLV